RSRSNSAFCLKTKREILSRILIMARHLKEAAFPKTSQSRKISPTKLGRGCLPNAWARAAPLLSRGGVAATSRKMLRSLVSGADGREARLRLLWRLRDICLMAQPPSLAKEGSSLTSTVRQQPHDKAGQPGAEGGTAFRNQFVGDAPNGKPKSR